MTPEDTLITIGDLKRELESYTDDTKIYFGCYELGFYRAKKRGEKLVQIEFNQSVYTDDEGMVKIDND